MANAIKLPVSVKSLEQAVAWCCVKWHEGHKRRYTGEDYNAHLFEVAGLVSFLPIYPNAPAHLLRCIAMLHDCIEDVGVKAPVIRTTLQRFDKEEVEFIIRGVLVLSDLGPGNRAQRFAASVMRLSNAEDYLQSLKCCDSYSNTKSIMVHDIQFCKSSYIPEKTILVEALTKADPLIRKMARDSIIRAEELVVQYLLKKLEDKK